MKILTKQQTEDWLARKLHFSLDRDSLKSRFEQPLRYALPTDSGQKTHLARALRKMILPQAEGLLWITGWGVWPSAENVDLFYGFRKSLGETRFLIDAPGHMFSEPDLADIECLLDITLYFFWDASLVEGSGECVVKISHDEHIDVYATNKSRLKMFQELFDDIKLRAIA